MRQFIYFFIFLLALILVACSGSTAGDDALITLPPPSLQIIKSTATQTLPAIINPTLEPPPQSSEDTQSQGSESAMMIGIESSKMKFRDWEELIAESGLRFVRHNGLIWDTVEPNEGNLQWDAVADLETKLEDASANGLATILIIRGTPSWAQKQPGSKCGPITQDKLNLFASFMFEAVSRYSAPPYNVKYWELGNEPDVDPSLVQSDSVFGCWGDKNDPYYGGRYYAEMLKVTYPAIKAADPEAKVLIGGLLLDCDPTNPAEGQDCSSGKFFEGVLIAGGGDYFDIVSFHGYPPYTISPFGEGGLYYDEHFPSWEQRGGVVLGKVDFLRNTMAAYSVDKPIIHTEGSLICPEWNSTDCNPPGDEFFDSQADYVVWLYVRNWANGLLGTMWYKFEGPGWRFGSLLDQNQNPRPAYYALKFLTEILNGAQYSKPVKQYDQVNGYEFIGNQGRIIVLWSSDELPHAIALDQIPENVYDKYGNQISLQSNEVVVKSPIYLEFSP